MKKFRGFKLGRRMIKISKWVIRKTRKHPYKHLKYNKNNISPWKEKLLNWGRRMSTRAKSLCSLKQDRPNYMLLGQEEQKPMSTVPKGHLAVYIGRKDGDFQRVLVPVLYFNHPLFGELLREAENEFGFAQQGGITIPCRFAEFESVKTRIDAAGGPRMMGWLRHC